MADVQTFEVDEKLAPVNVGKTMKFCIQIALQRMNNF
jgi:hypothetical protein